MSRPLPVAAFAACLCVAIPTLAQPEDEGADRARDLLLASAQWVEDQGAVAFTLDYKMVMKAGQQQQDNSSKLQIAYAAPNRLSVFDPQGPFFVKSDGEDLMTRFPEQFSVASAPEGFAGLLRNRIVSLIGNGEMQRAFHLLKSDAAEALLRQAETKYVGLEQVAVGDAQAGAHHLTVATQRWSWDVWIDAGDAPRLVRIVPDASKLFSKRQLDAGYSAEVALDFVGWRTGGDDVEGEFVLAIPEGAEFVEDVFGSEEGPHPLLGQQAPEFALQTLDGDEVKLSELTAAGKTVVLDFWATWCGPCVAAMPIIDGVTAEYADRGVVLYAVNQQEPGEKVSAFLEEKGLEVSALLDSDGEVGDAFGVSGLPTSVVVGPTGAVQAVHVGLAPNLKAQLASELEAILSGKDLAQEAVAERERILAERAEKLDELTKKFARKSASRRISG